VLLVLSPAKSLDYESPLATKKFSEPQLVDHAAELVDVMRTKSPAQLSKLMSISEDLADLNHERFVDWELPLTRDNARPAVLAFNGDVYRGLDAAGSFSERDFTHAQKTIRVLSGLYGVLRPLDLMAPYRLEMGTKLKTDRGRNLYEFWGSQVTDQLNKDIAASPGTACLVNLASNEYFGVVKDEKIEAPIVAPAFLDEKNGEFKVISFFAKAARGAMAGWMVQERIKSIRGLNDFNRMGYRYDEERSTTDRPVFLRPEAV